MRTLSRRLNGMWMNDASDVGSGRCLMKYGGAEFVFGAF